MPQSKKGQPVVDAASVSSSQPKLTRAQRAKFWPDFWACADEVPLRSMLEVTRHYIWRGPFDTDGRPVFVPAEGPPLLAANVMWHYNQRKLQPGRVLQPDCGHEHCVRAEHQALVSRRSGRAA